MSKQTEIKLEFVDELGPSKGFEMEQTIFIFLLFATQLFILKGSICYHEFYKKNLSLNLNT